MPPNFRNHGNYVISVAKLGRFLGRAGRGGRRLHPHRDGRRQAPGRGPDRPRRPLRRQGPRPQGRRGARQLRARLGRGREGDRARRGHARPPDPGGARLLRPPRLAPAALGARREGGLGGRGAARPGDPHDGLAAAQGAPSGTSSAAASSTRWARTSSASGSSIGLDYTDATFSCHDLLQELKTHPFVKKMLEGGKRVAWGAKTIPSGGYWSMPRSLAVPGHGDRRRRGEHGQHPDAEGHPLRDARRDVRGGGDRRGAEDATRSNFSTPTTSGCASRRSRRTSSSRATCASRSRRASSSAAPSPAR